MTMTAETLNAVRDLLSRQLTLAQTLHATLESERDALIQLKSEDIEALGQEKVDHLSAIEQLEAQRAAFALNQHDDEHQFDDATRDIWQQLLAWLDDCRALNESNGALVTLQRQHVQQALGALYGEPQDGGVYDADGMQASHTHASTIAMA